MRDSHLFRSGISAHPNVQRACYFERFSEIVESGHVDGHENDEAIGRFLDWVNGWEPHRKEQIRSIHVHLIEKYPKREHLADLQGPGIR